MNWVVKLLCFFFLLTTMSCKEKPILLLDGFYSYDNYNNVVSSYPKSEIIDGQRDGLLYLKIPRNKHLNVDGEFKLLFYEDQLASVGFFPKDTSMYFINIDSLFGRKLILNEELLFGNLSIFKSSEWKKEICYGCREYFISWSDVRLLEKYDDKIW